MNSYRLEQASEFCTGTNEDCTELLKTVVLLIMASPDDEDYLVNNYVS